MIHRKGTRKAEVNNLPPAQLKTSTITFDTNRNELSTMIKHYFPCLSCTIVYLQDTRIQLHQQLLDHRSSLELLLENALKRLTILSELLDALMELVEGH